MVSEHDFMPTRLEYGGLPLPDTNLAGTSFLAALKDKQASGREQVYVYRDRAAA